MKQYRGLPERSARLSGLPAYVRLSRLVIEMSGSTSNSRRMKLAPMNPQPPVTSMRLIDNPMPIPVAAYKVIPFHEIRYGNQPRIIPASRLVPERGFRNGDRVVSSLPSPSHRRRHRDGRWPRPQQHRHRGYEAMMKHLARDPRQDDRPAREEQRRSVLPREAWLDCRRYLPRPA